MPSLVIELQREALDEKISSVALLRKAYAVAAKLNLESFKEWVELELNGYVRTKTEIPKYRWVGGTAYCTHPSFGTHQLMIQDSEIADIVSHIGVNNPLSEIEAIVSDIGRSHTTLFYPPPLKNLLVQVIELPPGSEPVLAIARTAYAKIVHAVRDVVLKWSLDLEIAGILGGDMTFGHEEKIRAAGQGEPARYFAKINIAIVENMTNSLIQQGSPGGRQSFNDIVECD